MSTINGTAGDDQLSGTTGSDVINGYDGNDILYGDAGNDTLYGGNGTDDLEGGAGNDKLDGGAGFDFASYVVATSAVTVSLAITTSQNTGGAGSDTLTNIEGLIGSAYNDTLTGNAGNNILDGGAGRDTLIGGGGNDILQVSQGSDYVAGEKFDGGTGYDALTLAQGEYDLSSSTISNIEELDGQNASVSMTPGQLNGMAVVNVNGIDLTASGTADLSGAQVMAGRIALGAPATLNLTGSTGPAHEIDGSSGDDHIYCGNGGDTVFAHDGNNFVVGGSGADTIYGGGGNDTLSGGDGADYIAGGGGNDVLNGDGGDDIISSAGTGNSTLNGGDGNDTLTAEHGVAGMDGGTGDDTLNVDDPFSLVPGAHLSGGTGNDALILTDSGYPFVTDLTGIVIDGIESLTGGSLRVNAPQLNGLKYLSARDVTIAGPGVADLSGATHLTNSFTIDSSGVTLNLAGAATNGVGIEGSAYKDIVTGSAGPDVIHGYGGNDVLNGDAGDDQISGGDGNDTITGGSGASTLDGEAGYDTIFGGSGDEHIFGGDGADNLNGGSGADTIDGGAGADTIDGGDGNDVLVGGAGKDIVNGGAGDDQLYIFDPSELVSGEQYNGGSGFDTLNVSCDANLANVAIGADVENLAAAGYTVKLTAAQLANFIAFADGDNVQLATGGTIDLSAAQSGQLSIEFASVATNLIVPLNGGGSNVTGGSGDDQITGGNSSDVIHGGYGNDIIDGGGGNDQLYGGPGVDILNGGAGDDTLYVENQTDLAVGAQFNGGDGFDTLSLPSTTINLSAASFSGIEAVSAFGAHVTMTPAQLGSLKSLYIMSIIVSTGGTVDLSAAHVSVDELILSNHGTVVMLPTDQALASSIDVYGGSGNDTITGGADFGSMFKGNGGNDILTFGPDCYGTLDGGDGKDVLTGGKLTDHIDGGTGNDLINASLGNDTIDGGDGIDTVSFAAVTAAVTVDLSAGTVTGWVSQTLSGIENITGSSAGDTLTGDSGNNLIDGGQGLDHMTGGAGDDTYIVDRAGDIVTELPGEGTDTIYSSIGLVLPAEVEKLILTGTALNGTGNALDNSITGNDGDNQLSGLDGNDTLSGGAGNDRLIGGAGIDKFTGGAGADTFVFHPGDLDGSVSFATAEHITDFTPAEGDIIDLQAIDAIAGGTNNPFTFIGANAFSHHAGELRYVSGTTNTVIMGDTNGDGVADFYLTLNGVHSVSAADFIL